jgi:hypothetical protein
MTAKISQPTVCILYGLGEGRLRSKEFRKALLDRDYKLTNNPMVADVIFAHSGGMLLLPPKHQAKVIICVDYTYWPRRSLARAHVMRLRYKHSKLNHASSHVVLSDFMSIVYLLHIAHTVRLASKWTTRKHVRKFVKTRVIFIRNRYDSFCDPEVLIQNTSVPPLISMPGGHDDLWQNPKAYIDLLQSLV